MMRVLLSDRVLLDIAGLPGCESCHEWRLAAKIWVTILNLRGIREPMNLSHDATIMIMQDSYDLEALLGLDGLTYEAAPGYIVEFNVKRVAATPTRPMAFITHWS